MITYPISLHRLCRQKRKARQPFFASFLEIAMRLQRPCVGRKLFHLVAMDQRAALRTLQCTRRNLPRTARTWFLSHFRAKWGHESAMASWLHHLIPHQAMSISRHSALNYSRSALIVYSPAELSQVTCNMFGLQHT